MTFKTHNDADIEINGTSLQGEVDASYKELCDLFGSHHDGDGYKVDAEWYVQFEDGTVATIYNWKNGRNYCGESGQDLEQIRDWHIGGSTTAAETQVQIALDLHRESKQEKKTGFEKSLESAFDIMETIRATKGEAYGRTVETAMLVHKVLDLQNILLVQLMNADVINDESAESITKIMAMITSRIIGLSARSITKDGEDLKAQEARDIMAWADRIMEREDASANELMKELSKSMRDRD